MPSSVNMCLCHGYPAPATLCPCYNSLLWAGSSLEQDLLPLLRLGPASPVYSYQPQSVASLLCGFSVGSKKVFPQLFPLCRSVFNMPEQGPSRSK